MLNIIHKYCYAYDNIQATQPPRYKLPYYEPIELFGGIDAFNHRIELDEKKRRLCKRNNIKLIEWKYSMLITKGALQKYLEFP